MFKKSWIMPIAVIAGLSVNAGMPAMAQPAAHQVSMGDMGSMSAMFKSLALTPDQKSKFAQLMMNMVSEVAPQREKALEIQDKLMNALTSEGKVTEETLKPIIEEDSALQQSMKTAQVKLFMGMRDILTPDQLKKLRQEYEQQKMAREKQLDVLKQLQKKAAEHK